MPVIIVHGQALEVPAPKQAGDKLSGPESELLNNLFLNRFLSRIRFWTFRHPKATQEEVQLQTKIILDTFNFEGDGAGLEKLAFDMAKELLERHLNQRGVPVPSDLDAHVRALLQAKPEIYALASQRMTVLQRVGSDMLSGIEEA